MPFSDISWIQSRKSWHTWLIKNALDQSIVEKSYRDCIASSDYIPARDFIALIAPLRLLPIHAKLTRTHPKNALPFVLLSQRLRRIDSHVFEMAFSKNVEVLFLICSAGADHLGLHFGV